MINKIISLKLFLKAHPDNVEGSEMADRLEDLESLEIELLKSFLFKNKTQKTFAQKFNQLNQAPFDYLLKTLSSKMLETAETKQNFSDNAFMDATLIFQTVFMDKIFDLILEEKINETDALKMVERAGSGLRKLIKTYANIDTIDLIENYS